MATANGLFEAHLAVANLDVSIAFYRDALRLQLAHVTSDRRAAFFWIGARGRAMLGLWSAGSAPQKITTHIAFGATLDDVLVAPNALRSAGIDPLDFDARPADEAVVIGWMPAACVYFRDPDAHLLEYVAILPDAPEPEYGVVSWSEWQRRRRERTSPAASGAR